MDVSAIKSLIEAQALQSVGNAYGNSPTASPTSSNNFSTLLNQAIGTNTNVNASQTLGLTSGLNNVAATTSQTDLSSAFTQLLSAANTFASTAQQSGVNLSSLANVLGATTALYNGATSAYTPATVQSAYTNTNAVTPTTKTEPSTTDSIASTSSGPATQYDAIIKKASVTYGIPEKMIKAVIKQESNFNNNATSHVGAAGLMQLMPATAQYLGVTNTRDPEQNIMAGTKYLKQMYDKFGNYNLMLAAYNAGPGNVSKYGGIPPFNETQNYVSKIMATYNA